MYNIPLQNIQALNFRKISENNVSDSNIFRIVRMVYPSSKVRIQVRDSSGMGSWCSGSILTFCCLESPVSNTWMHNMTE